MENINSKKQVYIDKLARLKEEKSKLERSFSSISTMRFISFTLGLVLFLLGVSDGKVVCTIFGIIFFVAFAVLVVKHGAVAKQIETYDCMAEVVSRYVKRFSDEWRNIKDDGSSFISDENVVAHDIDLLGPNSLYQLINVAHTKKGRRLLAEQLNVRNIDTSVIAERQAAVKELEGKIDFGIEFETAGVKIGKIKGKFDPEELNANCNNSEKIPAWRMLAGIILPIIEITLIVLWACNVLHYGFALIGFIFNLSFTWLTSFVTSEIIAPFYKIDQAIDGYMEMLGLVVNNEFETEELKNIKKTLDGKEGAITGLSKLKSILQAYNISYNPLLHQLLSGIILWDYQLAFFVSRWKLKYGNNTFSCFDAVAKLELLLSLSVIAKVRTTNLPEVIVDKNEKVLLEGEEIYHPLLNPEAVVANSAKLYGGITIVTGSNMSGKTTFLRSLAVNLVLAYIGAPVCAKKLTASWMNIFTSMRITDDVANGISTFYAEILRIKAMAEFKKENKPMICLIDEIFKGTNSADRIVGATEVIKGLGDLNCMTIVSTHDFELCEMKDKNAQNATNYHFEEYYEEDTLKFDYRIKNGRCTTTNAKAILKMAGFNVQN